LERFVSEHLGEIEAAVVGADFSKTLKVMQTRVVH